MSSSPERSRGDLWAARLARSGWWAQKLPSSAMAGLPDWLVGRPGDRACRWVEAKAALSGTAVYRPEQLTTAQVFFLDRVHRAGDRASVLILAPDRFLELDWSSAREPLPRHVFDAVALEY